jgi:prepilin-type N-terminal cleavage/methylation domain-containing protein
MPGCSDTFYSCKKNHADSRGFSLVELIVVMGIFLTVMMITSSAFKLIANSTSQQSKSAETQIEGIVGLEVLRADLQQAGFGLPWSFQGALTTYLESGMDNTSPQSAPPFWPSGSSPSTFNDSTATAKEPRAILSANTNFNIDAGNGSKYIVIKSTAVATNDTAKRWTTVSYAGGLRTSRTWGDSSRDFAAGDRVVVVKNNLNSTPVSRQLKVRPDGSYSATMASPLFTNYTTLMTNHVDGDTYQVYGVAPGDLGMPFNRADYYIRTPATNMPQGCAPHTGVLYKANITHTTTTPGGVYAPIIPLVDCVADMQIVYGLDGNGAGSVTQYLESPANTTNPSASDIRSQLKEIRVYILAQDGKKDSTFSYPSPQVDVGESLLGVFRGRHFDLNALIGIDYKNYRWKVYTIVVRPLNLVQ